MTSISFDPTIKKVLKRDCDIDIDPDDYDWIILVGSDAMKYFTKLSSVTEYSGKKVEGKCLLLTLRCSHLNRKPRKFGKQVSRAY